MRIWTMRDVDGNILTTCIGEADNSFIGTYFNGVLVDSVSQEADRGDSAAKIKDAANALVVRDIANIVNNFTGSISSVEGSVVNFQEAVDIFQALINDFKVSMSAIVGNLSFVRYAGTGPDNNRIYMTNPITGEDVMWTSTSVGVNSLRIQDPYGGAVGDHSTTYVAPDRTYAIVAGVTGNGYATLLYN